MERRNFIAATFLAICLGAGVSSVQAQTSDSHPIIGTWRLNLETSSFEPGPGPRAILRRFVEGDDGFITSIRITASGEGNPSFAMVRMKFDGQDYEVWTNGGLSGFLGSGNRPTNTAAFAAIGDNTLELVQKNNGEAGPLSLTTWAVSSDGSTLTVTREGTAPDGTEVRVTEVYDRAN